MAYEYSRNLTDATKTVTTALPAANANANSNPIDLEQEVGGLIENAVFELALPATPSLADAKTIILKVQHSATSGSGQADLDPACTFTVTGAGGAGAAAKTIRFRLPPNALRYISVNAAVLASGGDNTGVSYTLRLLV